IHGTRRNCRLYSRYLRQARQKKIARLSQARYGVNDDRFASLDGSNSGALYEWRCTGRVVFDELSYVLDEFLRHDDPAQSKPCHEPRLGERVHADHPVLSCCNVQKRGSGRWRLHGDTSCSRTCKIEPLVRVVGENPDTVPTAVLEDGHLAIAIDRPAR